MNAGAVRADVPERPLRGLEEAVHRLQARSVTRLRMYLTAGGAIALSCGVAFALVESHRESESETRAAEFGTDRAMIDGIEKRLVEMRETINKGFDEIRTDVKTLLAR